MKQSREVEIILRKYNKCLNMQEDGCDIEWKHDECRILREILFEITGEERYSGKGKWWVNDN